MLIISIYNDATGEGDTSNYTYRVASGPNIIAAGRIMAYDPREGWPELLQAVAKNGLAMRAIPEKEGRRKPNEHTN